jgi:hypothetical protein
MSNVNLNETAPTQFQDIGGVSLAYRHFGKERTSKASARPSFARFDSVTTFMSAPTLVPHERTSCPFTSTMQVSQVSIGPMRGE